MISKNDRIYIAGHCGMIGSAIVRLLKNRGFYRLILRSSKELDLRKSSLIKKFFADEKPDVVVLAAARVGGIQTNIDHPAEFLYENFYIQNNVIHESYSHNVKEFCFLGSSCIYPREWPQTMKEEYLITGNLERVSGNRSLFT